MFNTYKFKWTATGMPINESTADTMTLANVVVPDPQYGITLKCRGTGTFSEQKSAK